MIKKWKSGIIAFVTFIIFGFIISCVFPNHGHTFGILIITVLFSLVLTILFLTIRFVLAQYKLKRETQDDRYSFGWESGKVAFLFFLAVDLIPVELFFNPFTTNPADNALLGIILIILPAIVLTAIFMFSQYKTKRKIQDGQYRVGWVVKYNLLLSLVLYLISLAVSSVSILGIIFYSDMEGIIFAFVGFFGLFIAPLVILVFSVVPSLLLYKFYNNKTILRILFWIVLVLSITIIAYYSVWVATCESYHNSYCLSKKAIKAQDSTICEKSVDDWHKTSCYNYISK